LTPYDNSALLAKLLYQNRSEESAAKFLFMMGESEDPGLVEVWLEVGTVLTALDELYSIKVASFLIQMVNKVYVSNLVH